MTNQTPGLWPETDSPIEANPKAHEDSQDHSGESEKLATVSDTAGEVTAATMEMPREGVATQVRAADEAALSGEKKSKSKRIREFLDQHPEARNRDVASALAAFGVTAADVANAKAQLKAKAVTPVATPMPVAESVAVATPAVKKVKKKTAKKTAGRPKAAASPSAPAAKVSAVAKPVASVEIGLSEVDAAIQFIEQAGGMERARQLIDLVDRIRNMNIG